MHAGSVARVEQYVDRFASALFAGACSYAAYAWFDGSTLQLAESAAFGAFAYLVSVRSLGEIKGEPRKPVPIFDVRDVEPMELPELLLTERYDAPAGDNDDALVLDDILTKLGSDSRVVRLFDPAQMPTPGELNGRIERRLARSAPLGPSGDATQALHDALAELRRSIR